MTVKVNSFRVWWASWVFVVTSVHLHSPWSYWDPCAGLSWCLLSLIKQETAFFSSFWIMCFAATSFTHSKAACPSVLLNLSGVLNMAGHKERSWLINELMALSFWYFLPVCTVGGVFTGRRITLRRFSRCSPNQFLCWWMFSFYSISISLSHMHWLVWLPSISKCELRKMLQTHAKWIMMGEPLLPCHLLALAVCLRRSRALFRLPIFFFHSSWKHMVTFGTGIPEGISSHPFMHQIVTFGRNHTLLNEEWR